MLDFLHSATKDIKAKLSALDKSQAVIEFSMDGNILHANPNFLDAVGYALPDIKGKHHSMFVDAAHVNSHEYKNFWAALNRGEYQSAEYRRFGKGGKEIWIQASYNPIMGANGKPIKVVKYATDITQQKLQNADFAGQIEAIGKSQAVISFNMDGTILDANPNFLGAVGYKLEDIKGKHHQMFVDDIYRNSHEYKNFWAALNRGEYQAAEYRRIGQGGREIWIQASYNPIFDMNGKPFKVVKYATDITAQVQRRMRNEQSQKMIELNLQGVDQAISNANIQSSSAAGASIQTSSNVQMVASGAEELNASVREIAESMMKSKAAADRAFDSTVTADQATQRLAKAALAMGGIVEIIQNIGEQINLLALNATIESARAGDAGKGFAVVAGEVKTLAKQATDATKQISDEIANMRGISDEVVKSLDLIKSSIGAVREYVTSTASAVEEQSAVAREMSANMQTAAQSVASITNSIEEIARSTEVADNSTKQVKDAVRELVAA